MSDNPTILRQFHAMPRVLQWAIFAGAAIVLFLAWDTYLQPIGAKLDKRSNEITSKVKEVRASEGLVRDLQLRDMKERVTALGPVEPPPDEAQGYNAFTEAVNTVLQNNGLSTPMSWRLRGQLPKTSLTSLAGTKRIGKLVGELKFDAAPKIAVAIIAELESSPVIAGVNSLRMTRDTAGKVKVFLTIEAWLLVSPEASRGATTP